MDVANTDIVDWPMCPNCRFGRMRWMLPVDILPEHRYYGDRFEFSKAVERVKAAYNNIKLHHYPHNPKAFQELAAKIYGWRKW